MKRWLFNAFAVMSLLLGATSIVFWVRSYKLNEACNYRSHSLTRHSLIPFNGSLFFEISDESHGWFGKPRSTSTGFWTYSFPPERFFPRFSPLEFIVPVQFNHMGFAYAHGDKVLSVPATDPMIAACDLFPTTILACPFWLITILSILPTAFVLQTIFRRRRRHAKGLCPSCSYDLRSHHPGEKCPECGRVIEEGKV